MYEFYLIYSKNKQPSVFEVLVSVGFKTVDNIEKNRTKSFQNGIHVLQLFRNVSYPLEQQVNLY